MTPRQRELRREYKRIYMEVQRRRRGVPPRRWRKPRPLPGLAGGCLLDPAPLLKAIDHHIREHGESEAKLAARAGVPARAIYRIRYGESKRVQLGTADRFAVAIGVPLALIYPEP